MRCVLKCVEMWMVVNVWRCTMTLFVLHSLYKLLLTFFFFGPLRYSDAVIHPDLWEESIVGETKMDPLWKTRGTAPST